MIEVVYPANENQLDEVRKLIRAFLSWHRERHTGDIKLIDEYFDAAALEYELASLPGKYGMPRGRLLLALYNGEAAGCVALREIDKQSCEMKRMFVYTQFQGKGIGYTLAERIIEEARKIGYQSMKLDTSIRQTEAVGLYQKMGFKKIEPYYELQENLVKWLVFMEKII